jgi:iron complex outermembrane receptor protein
MHTKFHSSSSLLAIILGASIPSGALAQTVAPPASSASVTQDAGTVQTAPSDPDAAGKPDIVVTGSRIARPEFSRPNPIQSFNAETIKDVGATNITEFLQRSPALLGSLKSSDTAGSNLPSAQLTGVNELNLRNLGTQRTLVLVDGRRHIAAEPGSAAVDTDTIPVDLIDRIDVLTGGTSAVYGADGVSGVVNFVMKHDFEGISLRGQSGISQRGDAGNRFISATVGHNFADNRGNVAAAYEFNETDKFRQVSRLPYAQSGPYYRFVRNPADLPDNPTVPDRIPLSNLRWADSSPGGAIDVNGDGVPDFTGEGGVYDPGTYVKGSPFTIGGSSTPQDSYFGDYTPYTRRNIANVMGSFKFSPALRLFAEGKFVRTYANTDGQPSFDFYTTLYPDNAYLNAKFPGVTDGATILGRDNFDFGLHAYDARRDTLRGVIGADGAINSHARYEVSFVYGQAKSKATTYNDRISDRYYAALDSVVDPATGRITCRINLPGQTDIQSSSYNVSAFNGPPVTFAPGQCVPLNVLGFGSPTPAALAFILANHTDHAKLTQSVLSGSISGDTGAFLNLPGGPVGFAFGGEYRRETSDYIPSDLELNNQLLDGSGSVRTKGKFNVKEAFGEVNLPLFKEAPFAYALSVGAAGRISKYSTIGSTKSWSFNGTYAPIRDLSFRGTISQAVRAPNIGELFQGASGAFEFISDPCGIDQVGSGSQYRQANCNTILNGLGVTPSTFDPVNNPLSPANSSLLGTSGGNPRLREETARSWTAGAVLRPRFLPNLLISADWYNIRIRNAINTASAEDLAKLCVDQPTLSNPFCSAITRNPTTGVINGYTVSPQNVAAIRTSGLDVALDWRIKPKWDIGTFNVHVIANYLRTLTRIASPGADVENQREYATTSSGAQAPKFSGNATLNWRKGPFDLTYDVQYFSRTLRFTREQIAGQPDIVAPQYIRYKENWLHNAQASIDVAKKFNFYLGVNNLFDAKPDVGAIAYPVSAVGRFFYAGVRVRLGGKE